MIYKNRDSRIKQFEQEMGIKLQDAEYEILKKLEYFHSHKFDDKKKEEYSKFLDNFMKVRYNEGRNALHMIIAYILIVHDEENKFFMPHYKADQYLSALSSVAFHAKILSKQKDKNGETPLKFANRLLRSNHDNKPLRILAWHFENIGIDISTILSVDSKDISKKISSVYWKTSFMKTFLPQLMELKYTIWRFRAVLGVFQSQTGEEEYVDRIANSGKDDVEREKIRNNLEAKLIYRKKLFEAFKLGLESSTSFLEAECNKKMKMVTDFVKRNNITESNSKSPHKMHRYFFNLFLSIQGANGFLDPLAPLFSKTIGIFPTMLEKHGDCVTITFFRYCVHAENTSLLNVLIKRGMNVNAISKTEKYGYFEGRCIAYTYKKTLLDELKRNDLTKNQEIKEEMITLLKKNGAFTYAELEEKKRSEAAEQGFCA